MSWKLTFVKN